MVKFVGQKRSIEKLEEELSKADLPWDSDTSDFKLVILGSNEEEYKRVSDSFKKTLPNNTITSIKRIQNSELFLFYQEHVSKIKKMKERRGGMQLTGNEPFEKFLWHGTKNTNPMELVDRTTSGLSTQYASESCMWGKGVYFAENASYSINYSFSENNCRYMLYCKVFVGEYIEMPPKQSLKEPPYRDEARRIMYDSVKGNTGGSDVYILYENNRNYPFYLVEFK